MKKPRPLPKLDADKTHRRDCLAAAHRAQATAARNYAATCMAITRAYKANHEAQRRLDLAQKTRAAIAEAL